MKNGKLLQNVVIKSLQQQFAEVQEELKNKDKNIKDLEEKLIQQNRQTDEWRQKFELQDLKTERALERRIEQEEKVIKLEKIVTKLKGEIKKTNTVQLLLGSQIQTFKKQVEEQRFVLEEKQNKNTNLVAKVSELKELCKNANEKISLKKVHSSFWTRIQFMKF